MGRRRGREPYVRAAGNGPRFRRRKPARVGSAAKMPSYRPPDRPGVSDVRTAPLPSLCFVLPAPHSPCPRLFRHRRHHRRPTPARRCACPLQSRRRASTRPLPRMPPPIRSSPTSRNRCSTTTTSRDPSSSCRARSWQCRPWKRGAGGFTMQVRKGIFFTPDPAFRGKPRELTAADHVYGLKRILDPGVKSPWLWMLEGKIVGADEAREKALKTGRFDYDAPIAGLDRRRSLYAEDPAEVSRPALSLCAGGPQYRRHGARSRRGVRQRHRRASGRHGTVHARASTSAARASNCSPIRATGRSPTCPAVPSRRRRRPQRRGSRESVCRFCRRIDISVMEEGQGRWLAFLNREIDYLGLLPPNLTDQALSLGKLKPDLAAKGIVHQVLMRPNVVFDLLQHGGRGGRRLYARTHCAAPRDRHGLQQRRGDSRALCGPGEAGQRSDPART